MTFDPIRALATIYTRLSDLPGYEAETEGVCEQGIAALAAINRNHWQEPEKAKIEKMITYIRSRIYEQKNNHELSESAQVALNKLDDVAIETLNSFDQEDRISKLPDGVYHHHIMPHLDERSKAALRSVNKRSDSRDFFYELRNNPKLKAYVRTFNQFPHFTDSQLKQIRYLNFDKNRKVSADEFVDLLSRFPNLHRVNLTGTLVDERALEVLSGKLTHLQLKSCHALPQEISMERFPHLELLELHGNTRIIQVHELDLLKDLKNLNLGLCIALTTDVLSRIENLTHLQRLILPHVRIEYTQENLKKLARHTQLQELDISSGKIDGDLSVLSALNRLEKLTLTGCLINVEFNETLDEKLAFLLELSSLKELYIEGSGVSEHFIRILKQHNPDLKIATNF
jgi:hypothetical protein